MLVTVRESAYLIILGSLEEEDMDADIEFGIVTRFTMGVEWTAKDWSFGAVDVKLLG